MAIVRWTPARPGRRNLLSDFGRLRNEMLRMFDSAIDRAEGSGLRHTGVFPPLNLSEDEDNLYVTAELPGLSAEDVELSVEGDQLTLRGERRPTNADKTVNYHRRERESGFFRRVISLPVKIDSAKVSAVTRSGVLNVTLPKAEEAKPRQVTVNSA